MYVYVPIPFKYMNLKCIYRVENRRNKTAKQLSQNLCATERTFSLSQKLPWYCAYWAVHDYGDTILQKLFLAHSRCFLRNHDVILTRK